VSLALERGVNILDCFMSEPNVRSDIGKALAGRRESMVIQGHFRSVWKDNQYARTTDLSETQSAFDDLTHRLATDYIDVGMLHMIDSDADYEQLVLGEIGEYARKLQSEGRIRFVGMSSHNPAVALRAVREGAVSVLLFSLNPAFDLMPDDIELEDYYRYEAYADKAIGRINPAREALYAACAQKGVGITVMKTYAAGALLDAKRSPFGQAASADQCIAYALGRPGVASVLIGAKSTGELLAALHYEDATPQERDYSSIFSDSPLFSIGGKCMYCNHCLPCAAGIDIAGLSRCLDLALIEGDVSQGNREAYLALEHRASECVSCYSCEQNCPFSVPVVSRMQQAAGLFGV